MLTKNSRKFTLQLILLLHLYPALHMLVAGITGGFQSPAPRLLFENYPLYYAIIVFAATLLGAVFRRQIMPEKGFGRACAPFLLPLALINTLGASSRSNLVSHILVAFSSVCALIIFLVANNKLWKHILSYVVSVPIAALATILVFPAFFPIGCSTVVREITSPDGQYTAYLIDVDQGALGGDTKIEIMKKPLNLTFGRYTGYYDPTWDKWTGVDWLSKVTFDWKDNDTLIYGNTEINIEK